MHCTGGGAGEDFFVWTSAPHEVNKGPAKSIPVWLKGGSSETRISGRSGGFTAA